MKQYCVDANIFLTAWNVTYPKRTFPTLWKKIAENKSNTIIIKPVFDEIEPVSSGDNTKSLSYKKVKYPIRMWLSENKFIVTEIDSQLQIDSLQLEKEYEIVEESKGASQIDMVLITYAKKHNKTVVTLESRQNQKPKKRSNYKIPLICQEQNVACINFVAMLDKLSIRV